MRQDCQGISSFCCKKSAFICLVGLATVCVLVLTAYTGSVTTWIPSPASTLLSLAPSVKFKDRQGRQPENNHHTTRRQSYLTFNSKLLTDGEDNLQAEVHAGTNRNKAFKKDKGDNFGRGQKETQRVAVDEEKSAQSIDENTVNTQELSISMQYDPNITVTCSATPYVTCQKRINHPGNHGNTTSQVRVFKINLARHAQFFPLETYRCSLVTCDVKACTFDEGEVSEQTDVVFIHTVGLTDKFPIPKRWPHQFFVMSSFESPDHIRAEFMHKPNSKWNDQFNLTLSYRLDADIFQPYGRLRFEPRPLAQRPDYYEIAKNKTKMAAWIVSNCKTSSGRLEYVRQMQKFIDVDIYGNCGTPCGNSCNSQTFNQYKFYLAFENSFCRDYVTEKFFKFFNHDMHIVQVVRGGFEYEKYFPEFTFINAAKFKSPKLLALYLKDLASDLHIYSKYLEYTDLYGTTGEEVASHGCPLCKYFHSDLLKPNMYTDMKAWLNQGHCRKGEIVSG